MTRRNGRSLSRCVRNTMRLIARRISYLTDEVTVHDTAMKDLVDEAAPQLVAEPGIGYVTASMLYIAWSHPGRGTVDLFV